MAMKAQTKGVSRQRRGPEKHDEDGKKLPPSEYDILLGKEVIGSTIREDNRQWRAISVKPQEGWPEPFPNWSDAVSWLVDTWTREQRELQAQITEGASEGGLAEEAAQVVPGIPFHEHHPDDECAPPPAVPDIPFGIGAQVAAEDDQPDQTPESPSQPAPPQEEPEAPVPDQGETHQYGDSAGDDFFAPKEGEFTKADVEVEVFQVGDSDVGVAGEHFPVPPPPDDPFEVAVEADLEQYDEELYDGEPVDDVPAMFEEDLP